MEYDRLKHKDKEESVHRLEMKRAYQRQVTKQTIEQRQALEA